MTLLFLLDQSLHYPVASTTALAAGFGADTYVGEIPVEWSAATQSIVRDAVSPIAFGADQAVGETPVEFGSTRRLDGVVPDETGAVASTLLARDTAGRVEFGRLYQRDAWAPTDASSGRTDGNVASVELGRGARRDNVAPSETGHGVTKDNAVPTEFTAIASSVARNVLVPIAFGADQGTGEVPIEFGSRRLIDRLVPTEFGAASSGAIVRDHVVPLDLSQAVFLEEIPLETVALALRSIIVPTEWAAAASPQRRDIVAPVAFGADQGVGEIPLEFGSRSIVGYVDPTEPGALRSLSRLVPFDTGRLLTRDSFEAFDLERIVNYGSFVPVEFSSRRLGSPVVPIETLSLRTGNGAILFEVLLRLNRDAGVFLERATSVNSGAVAPTEWLTLATITSIARNLGVLIEFSAGRQRSPAQPPELNAGRARSGSLPAEVLALLRSGTAGPFDVSSVLALSEALRVDVTAIRSRAYGDPSELAGTSASPRIIAIEISGSIRVAQATPEEAAIAKAVNAAYPIDLAAGGRRDGTSPTAWGATLLRQHAVPLEFSAQTVFVARSTLAPIEWLALRTADPASRLEILSRIARTILAPEEFRSLTTGVGVSVTLVLEIAPHLSVIGYALGADRALWVVLSRDEAVDDLNSSSDEATGQVTSTDI